MAETIRNRLKRYMFWSNAVVVAIAFFGFALPPLLPIDEDARKLTVGVGAVALVAWAAFVRRFPCPRCGNNIGGAFGNRAAGFALSGRKEKPANACPRCGLSLDTPMPTNSMS
jgi:predicted RNA-binding Zn-ribbon protein involved in translation (DUF1610 family)